MLKTRLEGVALPVSKRLLGGDNRNRLAEGAIVRDAWMEARGECL